MRASATSSSASSPGNIKPLQPPPPRFLQSTSKQLLAVVFAPLVLFLLVLWGFVSFCLRLSSVVVATISVAVTWALYVMLPGIPMDLVDWPIVFTLGYAAIVFAKATPMIVPLGVWAALAVYAIVRSELYETQKHDATRSLLTALTVLGCVLPLWVAVCRLRLWVPANEKTLEQVEKKIYKKYIATDHSTHVVAGLGTVHVPFCGDALRVPPRTLVLVHGYGAGNAFWAANLQTLAKTFNVYAVEWKGIGRSIRPTFRPKNDQETDDFFVESLEDWRRVMQLEQFILCCHSMGAIYSSYYVEKYPQHVEHLILVSPAGVASSGKTNNDLFWAVKLAASYNITPMSLIRFCGPFGLSMMKWVLRRRIQWVPETNIIRSGDMDFDDISLYCYHNWALKSSGDKALYTHLHPGALAQRRPLDAIFTPGNVHVPLTFLFGGGGDWMPSDRAHAIVQRLEQQQYAVFRLVPSAGHQVFMDNPADFNSMVIAAVHDYDRVAANQ